MTKAEPYVYPYVSEVAVKCVRRRCGDAVAHMPPVLIAFLYHTYNGGGYPIYHSGPAWDMSTSQQHIKIDVLDPTRARLRAWAKKANREINAPAVDRIIMCEGGYNAGH